MLEIVPSLASANQSCLKDEIEKLGKDTVKEIHLDKAHCLQGICFSGIFSLMKFKPRML